MKFDTHTAFDLTGRVALVTGGSRGLGEAMVHGLARAGADVVVASRNLDSCKETAAEVERDTGRSALPVSAHVGRWADLDALVEAAYERFGRIDVLVNNAGMSPLYDSLDGVSEELFDKVIGVNLKGPFRLAALVGTKMAAAGGGSIINISSAGALHPRPEIAPYSAAKAGLNALTVGFAHAFGPAVRCNAIVAGTFHTDVSASWDSEQFARRAEGFALQRGGQPEEIVGTALYLASDASSYTTGALLTVDGGQR
ncbi:SDR family NAD(P)-dependent oxidoreductase [Haloactinomyces albus]|uniref:NAD(P)-dependent dehydrogenase (Short-subunit alcohol dehydrogenase family) n=1 Tax=Haloactinomyces albus TaxID=1352928 RepID=A0AAE4CQA2_9ACTN|nr:SDR family oxidoreductase [Haloactinomyces albus]MDR7303942.1 NAD(P)-dependent dehydrogenase (short-subunit alcohol dehydrogenase family) [Haloactinomyces albus]